LRSQHSAGFTLPGRLHFVDELPISPAGKILKRQQREAIALKLQQEQRP